MSVLYLKNEFENKKKITDFKEEKIKPRQWKFLRYPSFFPIPPLFSLLTLPSSFPPPPTLLLSPFSLPFNNIQSFSKSQCFHKHWIYRFPLLVFPFYQQCFGHRPGEFPWSLDNSLCSHSILCGLLTQDEDGHFQTAGDVQSMSEWMIKWVGRETDHSFLLSLFWKTESHVAQVFLKFSTKLSLSLNSWSLLFLYLPNIRVISTWQIISFILVSLYYKFEMNILLMFYIIHCICISN